MTITWIKCSERMPPENLEVIINDICGCMIIKALDPKLPKHLTDSLQWIPYTEEVWKELNK